MHTNQRLLVQELIRRGAKVEVVDDSIELVEVSYGGHSQYMMDRAGKALPYLASAMAADKHLTKMVLRRKGIQVPDGELFGPSQIDQALDYADALGYPVVAKPNVGSHGDGVRSGIRGRDELESSICSLLLAQGKIHFIVERHVEGSEFRIFVTSKGAHAALLREPASVVGDGESCIAVLALVESQRRARIKAERGSSLSAISLDSVVLEFLARQGRGLSHVLADGERQFLRLSSNLAQGGSSMDASDKIHPSALAMAKAALAAFEGLPCLGIDFIVGDISAPVGGVNPGAIIEVNANPGLAMHHMPAIGEPRDAASMLADAIFPDLLS